MTNTTINSPRNLRRAIRRRACRRSASWGIYRLLWMLELRSLPLACLLNLSYDHVSTVTFGAAPSQQDDMYRNGGRCRCVALHDCLYPQNSLNVARRSFGSAIDFSLQCSLVPDVYSVLRRRPCQKILATFCSSFARATPPQKHL